jgi:hypothetical protein
MEIFLEKDVQNSTDKTTVLNVFLNSDKKEINVVEGKIKIDGSVYVKNIDKNKSILSMWTVEPLFNNGEIEFVGGTPSGVFGPRMKLFSFEIHPYNIGNINLSFEQSDVFLNDGMGTKVVAVGKDYQFGIVEIKDFDWLKISIGGIILLIVILFWLFIKRKNESIKK